MRLLLVEDDELFGSAIQRALVQFGYAVDWARSGKQVLPLLKTYEFACVLLDLGLPEISGDKVLESIRDHALRVSVIVITARGGMVDRVRLLNVGADDYMVKPIDLDELSARVRAVLRRDHGEPHGQKEIGYAGLKLFPDTRTATWFGKLTPLTKREFWLLETLVRRKSEILSRRQLEEALYGWGEEVESNAIEVYVHHLRQKFSPSLIQTMRGLGYQLGKGSQLV
jgi:DNA-binding response OmpR family regulator